MFKKLVLITIFIAVTSCSNFKVPIAANSYFYGSKVFNKELGTSATFFGDTKFENNTSTISKRIKQIIESETFLKDKIIISYLKTNSAPDYEIVFFYSSKKDSFKDGLIKNDKINSTVCFKKSDENKSLYLFLKTINSKSNKTILADGYSILSSITLDNLELEKTTYFDVFNGVKDLDNYLIQREKLKKAPLVQNNEQKFNQFQFLTTVNSFISNNKEYDSLILKSEKRNKEMYQTRVDSLITVKKFSNTQKSGTSKIIDLVKDEKVVMLNENHWYPKHRIVALQLLRGLKEKGFNYLAIEALFPKKDSILNIRGFPSKDTGYYTREPYFAHFLRSAKEIGFKIVEYDMMEGAVDRELAQATNIKKIIDSDSTAKIFVYAGIDHILESNSSKKRMAEYFKEISGINPVTFNQVKIIANTENEIEVFPSSDFNGFNNLKNNVDYFIINNTTPSFKKLYSNEEFGTYTLKFRNFKKHQNEEFLVKIYYENEYKLLKSSAIPIAIFSSTLSSKEFILDLPKGKYFAKVISKNEDKLFNDYFDIQ